MTDFAGRIAQTQSVTFSSVAGTISSVGSQTYRVLVLTTESAFIKIANGLAATSTDAYRSANEEAIFSITPGQTVSAVQVSAGGTLHVTELI